MKRVSQIIEAGELEIEMKFIEFEHKINKLYNQHLKKYE